MNLFLKKVEESLTGEKMIDFLTSDPYLNEANVSLVSKEELDKRLYNKEILSFLKTAFEKNGKKLKEQYFPKYQVETSNFTNYEIQEERINGLTNPYYNVKEEGNNQEVEDYVFLLRDDAYDDLVNYMNIYNGQDKRFIYKINQIPYYLNYLLFRSFKKYGVEDSDGFFSEQKVFKELFDNYEKKYREKVDENVIPLKNIEYLSEEEKKLKNIKKGGSIYYPNGVEVGGKSHAYSSYLNKNYYTPLECQSADCCCRSLLHEQFAAYQAIPQIRNS
jgi:hypothetical protein